MKFITRLILSLSTLLLGSALVVLFTVREAPLVHATNNQTPLSVDITASEYRETLSDNEFSSWFRLDTALVAHQKKRSEIENTAYCPVSLWYCDTFLSRFSRERLAVSFERTIEEDRVRAYVSLLASRVNQEPENALFGVGENDSIIVAQEEKVGRRLNENESVAIILRTLLEENRSGLSVPITLPTEISQPKIVSADRERLGLKELIGQGTSNFAGSPKNRIFNIKRALEQYENVLIAPGEEFSFVDYLGEVDGEHGYLPELVIKYNKTEPEFGGGICQVSSTVFRAAIYSGLKITERRNHAYAVSYYKPIGMDATIYIPKPDLKFTNNTPGYILMQSHIEGYNLTFRFFGTKDGRTVTIDGPHVLERGGDGSMKTVFSQEVSNVEGQNYIRDSFWSNYKSPSLFPHPGEEQNFTTKPTDWSEKQWKAYKATQG
ncbi:MAG: VanW family protein [Candidatus Moranbacteria bacterium]|nr:VanW family protein [Candidatus Moranbacteria bacterium]